MKQKIFIDTDIILDLFAEREPFNKAAIILFNLIEKNEIQAFTSPVVFSNLFYILTKLKTRRFAHSTLRKLRLLTNNPRKYIALSGYGLQIVERVPMEVEYSKESMSYMKTKKEKMGHLLDKV